MASESRPRVAEILTNDAEGFLRALSGAGEVPHTPGRATEYAQTHATPLLYRGQWDATWHLVPSALRPGARFLLGGEWIELPPTSSGIDRARAELWTMQEFFLRCDEIGLGLPEDSQSVRRLLADPDAYLRRMSREKREWPSDELLSVLALCQHFGLPTRLLDWSFNPRIAAYFAALGGTDEPRSTDRKLSVWVLDVDAFQSVLRTSPLRAEVFVVSAPRSSNPNLHAQDGAFTLLREPQFAWSARQLPMHLDELSPAGRPEVDHPYLLSVTVPASEAKKVLQLLARERVHAARLFPGFDGVVRFLRERFPGATR